MASRLVSGLLRSSLLFLLSVLLVAGFYFHSEFYQIGLYPLLLVGGFATFLVITAARLILSGDLPRGRPTRTIVLGLEEGDRLARRAVDLLVRPLDEATPTVGEVVRATYEAGPEVGRFRVLDVERRFLGDVDEAEARRTGLESAAALRDLAARRWGTSPDDPVALVRLRPQGAGP